MARVWKQGVTLLTGSGMAQLLPALAAPLITRVYQPHQFGVFAFVLAAFGILVPVACLRYDIAIVLPERDEEAVSIAALCLVVAIALPVALVAALLLVELYARQHVREIGLLLLTMLPAGGFLQGCQLVAQGWCLRKQNFKVMSLATATQAFATVASQLILGTFFAPSALNLVLGALLGNACAVLIFSPTLVGTVWRITQIHTTPKLLATTALRYRRFPLIAAPYAFSGQASVRGALLVLALWLPAAIVGQYALALRVTFLPVMTVTAALGHVFYARAARDLDQPRTQHVVRTVLRLGPWIIGPFFMLLALYGRQIFSIAFGTGWGVAGQFAGILALAAFAKTSTSWLDRIFDIRSRQHLALAVEALFGVLALAAMYLILDRTHDAEAGVAGYTLVIALFYVIWMMLALRVARFARRISSEYLLSSLVMVAVMLGAYESVHQLHASPLAEFAVMGLIGATLCAIALQRSAIRMTQSW